MGEGLLSFSECCVVGVSVVSAGLLFEGEISLMVVSGTRFVLEGFVANVSRIEIVDSLVIVG